jgi:3D (Asp-Asp-Asp) domain-containing protein
MFFLAKYNHASMNVAEPEFYEAAASEEIKNGEALVITNGKLTKCGATTLPQFVAMTDLAKDATKRRIPCARTDENQLWRVPVSADPTNLKPGDKITLDTDALTVTATTASGVVTVEDLGGAAKAGDEIYVRII